MRNSLVVPILAGFAIVYAGLARGELILGRLFLSPLERVALEQQRRSGGEHAEEVLDVSHAPPRLPGPISLDGYIMRSGAKSSVWINSRLRQDAQSGEAAIDATVDGSQRVRVRLADGRVRDLRVGQIWDPLTGVVSDVLNGSRDPGPRSDAEPDAPNDPLGQMAGSGADEP